MGECGYSAHLPLTWRTFDALIVLLTCSVQGVPSKYFPKKLSTSRYVHDEISCRMRDSICSRVCSLPCGEAEEWVIGCLERRRGCSAGGLSSLVDQVEDGLPDVDVRGALEDKVCEVTEESGVEVAGRDPGEQCSEFLSEAFETSPSCCLLQFLGLGKVSDRYRRRGAVT